MKKETITAIATGLTNAGISIIRISGDEALLIIDEIYQAKSGNKKLSNEKSHTIHYGYIVDEKTVIDEVMVVIMKAPATYTREDVVEIDCHGGIMVTKRILDTVLKHGARIAEPGEFTKRAFINGRIDLSQAEAICDIINSKNELALQNSINQLRGSELDIIQRLRDKILKDIAYIEVAIDDPEHINLDGFTESLSEHLNDEEGIINKLIKDADNGRIIKEGIMTVIVGKPNVGKSTLLNVLSGEERAIVTDIPGTTRDILEETLNLNGITLNVIDTAGIRDTVDLIEKIGVEKAKSIINSADLIIFVMDSSTYIDKNDEVILSLIKDKKTIVLLNKTDMKQLITITDIKKKTEHPAISISLKDGLGIDILEDKIRNMFFSGEIDLNDEMYITNERHIEALREAESSIGMVKQSISDKMPEDFYSIDLMNAYAALGRIIGENVEDDLVNMIFKEFCMGK